MKTILLTVTFFIYCAEMLSAQIPTNGLVAYLPFDGNANDSSGYGNNGTVNGATLTTDRFGVQDRAYYFDGSNDVLIQNSSSLNPTTSITICAWYKPDHYTGNGYGAIYDKGYISHTSPYYEYKIGSTGDGYSVSPAAFGFSLTVGGVEHRIMTSGNFWTAGQYYFIVGNYDGQTMSLYVNDTLIGSLNLTGLISTYATQSKVGNNTTADDFVTGTIDEILIYDRSLSTSEMTSVFQEGSVGINETNNSDKIFFIQGMNGIDKPSLVFKENLGGVTLLEVLGANGQVISSKELYSIQMGTVVYPEFYSGKPSTYFLRVTNGKNRWYTKVVLTRI